MKDSQYKSIVWGFILIALGVLFLLSNMELIELHWHNIWHLWPALLIYLGISALPINNYYKLGFFLVLTSLLIYILIKYPEPLQFNPDVHTI
ncbi:LiaI-LiaF-like domain-containing protein [Bacteroidota bacterium]